MMFKLSRGSDEQKHAGARHSLGWMYENGRGVPRDDDQAVTWYRKAAEQGVTEAQVNLGWMYTSGRGVPRDDAQAYMWFTLATVQGNEEALKQQASLVKHLTPVQITEGQRLIEKWLAEHPNLQGRKEGNCVSCGDGIN